jgi:integrase
MGRRPTNTNAVPRLRIRRRKRASWFYYDHGIVGGKRKLEALGADYAKAIARWAQLEGLRKADAPRVLTFRYVAEKYRAEVVPTKAAATQRDNLREIGKLLAFFDDPPALLEQIEPQHVRQYLRWRNDAPVRANREKALLSAIWNWCRDQGYTALANPCAGIKGNKETGRDVYVEEEAYRSVWQAADAPLRDALDLLYLTGQRPADVRRMDERDIRDGFLNLRQGKTGKRLRLAVEGELAAVLARIAERKAGLVVRSTRLLVGLDGQPLTRDELRGAFDRARAASGQTFQLRDLRAKAGTDKADAEGERAAQLQLGHTTLGMTMHYVRRRRGDKVTPTK